MSIHDTLNAEDILERHGREAVEEMAERNDEMGAAARAVLEVAGEDDG